MTKYDEGFKLKAVRDYLAGNHGYREVAQRHGIDHSMLRRWVTSQEQHGSAGLAKKFSHYDAGFKQQVLERIDRDGLSDRQAAALYDIRHAGSINL